MSVFRERLEEDRLRWTNSSRGLRTEYSDLWEIDWILNPNLRKGKEVKVKREGERVRSCVGLDRLPER